MTKETIKLEQKLLNNKLIAYLHGIPMWRNSELEIEEVTPVLTGLYITFKEKGKIQKFGRLASFNMLSNMTMSTEEFNYLCNSKPNPED